jgi:hypothetical protein
MISGLHAHRWLWRELLEGTYSESRATVRQFFKYSIRPQSKVPNQQCKVAGAENGDFPEGNGGFWKVAKITPFLATFWVHPWTVLTSHELVPQAIDCLRELFQEPLCGS